MRRRPSDLRRAIGFTATAYLFLAACGGADSDDSGARDGEARHRDTTSPIEADSSSSEPTGDDVPDPCRFFDVEEISVAIGREVGPGEPQTTSDGASSCRFEMLTGLSTSTSFNDPVIPETALGSVTVSTMPTSADEFDGFEALLADEAEPEAGVGDDAYFWGEDVVYVRVADRGFSVRVTADGVDETAVRVAILGLAELGASKL